MGAVGGLRKFHWGSKFLAGPSTSLEEEHSTVLRLTATLVGSKVLVIGQLGEWLDGRKKCKVCSVDLKSMVWTWVEIYGPHVEGHVAALAGDQILIHGGKDTNNLLGDSAVWSLDLLLMEWRHYVTYGAKPSRRKGHTAEFVEENRHFLLYGGQHTTLLGEIYDELWVMDVDAMVWRKPRAKGRAPSARYGHASCLVNTHLFIYGGFGETDVNRDCYVLHCKGANYRWSRVKVKGLKPPRVARCTLSFFSERLFVFGGSSSSENSPNLAKNALFCMDLKTYKWHRIRDVRGSDETAATEYTVTGKIDTTHSHTALTVQNAILIIGGTNRRLCEFGVLAPRQK